MSNLIRNTIIELNEAKKTKISSWIDSVSNKLDKAHDFFEVAEKVGLVKDGHYISGIPRGLNEDINLFYKLEIFLQYPKPQKI